MSNEISITIRLVHSGDELEVELPLYSTGKEIIDELIKGDIVPKTDPEGNPYVYKLVAKRSGTEIIPEKTLEDLGIKSDDTLLLTPKLIAGNYGSH